MSNPAEQPPQSAEAVKAGTVQPEAVGPAVAAKAAAKAEAESILPPAPLVEPEPAEESLTDSVCRVLGINS